MAAKVIALNQLFIPETMEAVVDGRAGETGEGLGQGGVTGQPPTSLLHSAERAEFSMMEHFSSHSRSTCVEGKRKEKKNPAVALEEPRAQVVK